MNDEIILRSLTAGSNVPFADEDGSVAGVDHRRARSNVTRREQQQQQPTKETAVVVGPLRQGGRNGQQCFASFRPMVQAKVGQDASDRREGSVSVLQKGGVTHGRKESPQYRRVKQSSATRRDRNDTVEAGANEPSTLQRYENAVLRYQKPKARPRRQLSRDRHQHQHPHQQQQQQQQPSSHGCSSSDESLARNKSKSISSIDTQSVNNILDEYEDLDYRRSSDMSDSGSVNVSNFEAVMMDQQRKQQQQQEKSRLSTTARTQPRRSPVRERSQPVLKVNQHTQVRQRSKERQRESSAKQVTPSPTEDNSASRGSSSAQTTDPARTRMPEVLLRKGEVQKRVDEWLSQTQSHSYPSSREKPLIRSNSSAEQKSQRRYRQDSRSRSIDEGREESKPNGTSSSYDDLSRADRKPDRRPADKAVPVTAARGTYKEYLASKSSRGKQQDYGFSASSSSVVLGRSRDPSPSTGSRIPQRGPLSSSFRSRRLEAGNDASQPDNGVGESAQQQQCHGERNNGRFGSTNLARSRNESDRARTAGLNACVVGPALPNVASSPATTSSSSSSSVIPCRRASFKRAQNHDQGTRDAGSRALVKEETGQRRTRGGCEGTGPKGPGNLGDQGEPISPNKDGESRRPALTSDSQRTGDKAAVEAACKSTSQASRSVPRIAMESLDSARHRQDRKDQTGRQENVYGVVGARVRSLQGQQENRATRTTNSRSVPTQSDVRKPPLLPRKEQTSCQREAKEDRARNPSIGSIRSTFKPNSRVYATLQQLNEQNSARSGPTVDNSAARSRYASPNHVEKIYERSLQPQVIHADDLESILRPCLQVSAYGESATTERFDRRSPHRETTRLEVRDEAEEQGEEGQEREEAYEAAEQEEGQEVQQEQQRQEQEEEVYERVGELRHEHLETIEEDDRKSEASVRRYPEVGLSHCLRIQQSLPNGRSKSDQHRDQRNEPARTFLTFHSAGSPRGLATSVQPRTTTIDDNNDDDDDDHSFETRELPESTVNLDDPELPYDLANALDTGRNCHTRQNSDLSTATIPLDELESERQLAKLKVEDACLLRSNETEARSTELLLGSREEARSDRIVDDTERSNHAREVDGGRGSVVNEVLVKNLQFKQDLPRDTVERPSGDSFRIIERGVQRPIAYHNVLCDDYDHSRDSRRAKESKVYVTREEMERQRLMDLLRKGDYESARTVSVSPFNASRTVFTRGEAV